MKNWMGCLLLALMPATSLAWGDECEVKADRAAGTAADGIEKIVIRAGAGDLKVVGRANAVRVEARGVACAATRELLEASRVTVRREGNVVFVETDLPQNLDGWAFARGEYAYVHLGIALPADVQVEALDSSGDAVFEDLRALKLQDSSGDIDIRRIEGRVDLFDSSGDVDVQDVGGLVARDSSGDLEVARVRGDADVEVDSSGDIRIDDVTGSVRIRQDSSGSIRIEDVKGDVDVDSDSSGDIEARRVSGHFTVGEDSSGSIEHESIGGRVTVPAHRRDAE